jgi:hypothetical protein
MEDDMAHEHEGLEGVADKLRDMPVGAQDPNIIGDAGPTDVPPGSDPPSPPLPPDEDVLEAPE